MKNLTQEELLELITAYNDYIQNANEEDLYIKGWKPVCIEEFYNNDFELWNDSNECN